MVVNSLGQNPCLVNAYVNSACTSDGQWVTPGLNGVATYAGPTTAEASNCTCSMVSFSLLSACQYCQGSVFSLPVWSEYVANCPAADVAIGYHHVIPSGTAIQAWAYDALTALGTWDPVKAIEVGDSGTPDSGLPAGATTANAPTSDPFSIEQPTFTVPTPTPFDFPTPTLDPGGEGEGEGSFKPKTRTKTRGGAIGGGVGGGAGGVLVVGAGGAYLYRKKRNGRGTHPSSGTHLGGAGGPLPPHTPMSEHEDKFGTTAHVVDTMGQMNNTFSQMPQLNMNGSGPGFGANPANQGAPPLNQGFSPNHRNPGFPPAMNQFGPALVNPSMNQFDPNLLNPGMNQGFNSNMFGGGINQPSTPGFSPV